MVNAHLALRPFQRLILAPRCSVAPLLLCALACCAVLPSLLLAAPHSLGWSKSSPQLWKDATYDVFESGGNLSVSDWTNERCFVGIRESFVTQILVQGTSWGQQTEGKGEEERGAIWKKFLMQCGADLTSPGLSVHSGALVRVLVFVHHMILFRLVDVGLLGQAKHLITLAGGRSEVHF